MRWSELMFCIDTVEVGDKAVMPFLGGGFGRLDCLKGRSTGEKEGA